MRTLAAYQIDSQGRVVAMADHGATATSRAVDAAPTGRWWDIRIVSQRTVWNFDDHTAVSAR